MGTRFARHGGCWITGLVTFALASSALASEVLLHNISEIRMDAPGRLTVRQGPVAVARSEQSVTFRQAGAVLVIEAGRESAPDDEISVEVVVTDLRKLASSGNAQLTVEGLRVDSFSVTLAGHGSIRVNDMTAADATISLSGHGSVEVNGLRANLLVTRLGGHGVVTMTAVATDKLEVAIAGHGRVEVSGSTRSQSLVVQGYGDYFAGDLRSQAASVAISGSGRAHLWVEGALTLDEMHDGTVRYRGTPTLHNQAAADTDGNYLRL